jgi:putative heme iron utilization protein
MPKQEADLDRARTQLDALQQGCRTLLLATADGQGEPELSYAPYVLHGGDFYVFVSELAAHTGNLLRSGRASVLFIENEADADHLFARRRLGYRCDAQDVAPEDERYGPVLGQMEAQFGNLVGLLRGLRDFHLIRLRPRSGQFVAGFGKAFEVVLDPEGGAEPQLRPIQPR